MTDNKQSNSSMVVLSVNVFERTFVLPSDAVAEIIEYQSATTENNSEQDWYLGEIHWRGVQVPLISLEKLNHQAAFNQSNNLKILVVHGLQHRNDMPYWAFVALETPRMQRIDSSRLVENSDSIEDNAAAKMWANLDDEKVLLPNFAAIEQALLAVR